MSLFLALTSFSPVTQARTQHFHGQLKLEVKNVTLEKADVFNLHYDTDSFDHIFVCFVLEHLTKPELTLAELKRVLKPKGTIAVIEGDHGSTYFFPDSLAAHVQFKRKLLFRRKTEATQT